MTLVSLSGSGYLCSFMDGLVEESGENGGEEGGEVFDYCGFDLVDVAGFVWVDFVHGRGHFFEGCLFELE